MNSQQLFSIFRAPQEAPENQQPAGSYTLAQAFKFITTNKAAEAATTKWRSLCKEGQPGNIKGRLFAAAFFSGTFSGRHNTDLVEESGLLCIDIDHAGQQGWHSVEELKAIIAEDHNLAARLAFVSPSADGLKVVLERPEGFSHTEYFNALQIYFSKTYALDIDKSCGNIARACYLPHDPGAFYTDTAHKLTKAELESWRQIYGGPEGNEGHTPGASSKAPEDKTGIAGAFCRCYTIQEAIEAFLPGIYTPTNSPRRYTYTAGSSYGGLIILNEGATAFSHHSTDPAGGRACGAFDLVRIHKYGNDEGGPESESYRQMAAFAANDAKVKQSIAEADFSEFARLEASTEAAATPQLNALLSGLHKIDFRKKAEELGLPATAEAVRKADKLVITILETLEQVKAQGSGLAYCNGSSYAYFGGYWRQLQESEARAFLKAAAIKLGITPIEAEHFKKQNDIFCQFQESARLLPPDRQPDRILINFRNGTLRIENGRLKPISEPRPGDFLTYQLPYSYDPGASCPMFLQYLNRVLPDESAQKVLAEFVSNTLAPALNLQKALVLQGSGCNGKSVFCDIVTAVLGRDNVSSYTMESLTKADSRSRAQLENKLLNYSGENSIKLNVEAFKTLVRNEPIEVRRLYEESYTMTHYARLMFNCNQLPRDIEQTEGFFRSFLIIPFKEKISEAEKDPQLASKIIAAELPGIFNWLLEGLRRLLQNRRYTDCEAARIELETYRKESNSVLMFIEDCALAPALDTKQSISLSELYNDYISFCFQNGFCRMNKITFSKSLRAAGFTIGRSSKGMEVYAVKGRETTEFDDLT